MKYLSHYVQDAQSELFSKLGAFFAFDNKTFKEQSVEGVEYCQLSVGMIVPKQNAQALVDGLEEVRKSGIAQDIKENGMEAIIRRELFNHEVFYTGDISSCIDALEGYGVQKDDVIKLFNTIRTSEDVY